MAPTASITRLLLEWNQGNEQARERLIPLVYAELRRIAQRQLRGERSSHTLQPTALVHELYLRLVRQRHVTWENRVHFYALTARLMRRILVDHARVYRSRKRGGSVTKLLLEEAPELATEATADILDIDEALDRLAAHDPEQARVVELRFFAGLTVDETALAIGVSSRTIKREWRLAKAWLYRELRAPSS